MTAPALPCIAWTVGAAGSSLAGRVSGLIAAGQARATFEAWRRALGLAARPEVASAGGVVHLRAAARRNQVRIGLTATVFEKECQ